MKHQFSPLTPPRDAIAPTALLRQLNRLDKAWAADMEGNGRVFNQFDEREAIGATLVHHQARSKAHAFFQVIQAVQFVSEANDVLFYNYDQPGGEISPADAANNRMDCINSIRSAYAALSSVLEFLQKSGDLGAVPVRPDLHIDRQPRRRSA